jgi:hypothetical protein
MVVRFFFLTVFHVVFLSVVFLSVVFCCSNETDCDPTQWNCMECPKTGALCSAGNGMMCKTSNGGEHVEACEVSKEVCEDSTSDTTCNGRWWGGDEVFDWIEPVPGYWR